MYTYTAVRWRGVDLCPTTWQTCCTCLQRVYTISMYAGHPIPVRSECRTQAGRPNWLMVSSSTEIIAKIAVSRSYSPTSMMASSRMEARPSCAGVWVTAALGAKSGTCCGGGVSTGVVVSNCGPTFTSTSGAITFGGSAASTCLSGREEAGSASLMYSSVNDTMRRRRTAGALELVVAAW